LIFESSLFRLRGLVGSLGSRLVGVLHSDLHQESSGGAEECLDEIVLGPLVEASEQPGNMIHFVLLKVDFSLYELYFLRGYLKPCSFILLRRLIANSNAPRSLG
jgi:hypothetical protein